MFLCAHAFSSCVHFAVVSGYDCVDVLQDILRDHIEQSKLSPAACHPEVSSALRARSQSCFAPDLASSVRTLNSMSKSCRLRSVENRAVVKVAGQLFKTYAH